MTWESCHKQFFRLVFFYAGKYKDFCDSSQDFDDLASIGMETLYRVWERLRDNPVKNPDSYIKTSIKNSISAAASMGKHTSSYDSLIESGRDIEDLRVMRPNDSIPRRLYKRLDQQDREVLKSWVDPLEVSELEEFDIMVKERISSGKRPVYRFLILQIKARRIGTSVDNYRKAVRNVSRIVLQWAINEYGLSKNLSFVGYMGISLKMKGLSIDEAVDCCYSSELTGIDMAFGLGESYEDSEYPDDGMWVDCDPSEDGTTNPYNETLYDTDVPVLCKESIRDEVERAISLVIKELFGKLPLSILQILE
jgi:hypothetical protein